MDPHLSNVEELAATNPSVDAGFVRETRKLIEFLESVGLETAPGYRLIGPFETPKSGYGSRRAVDSERTPVLRQAEPS